MKPWSVTSWLRQKLLLLITGLWLSAAVVALIVVTTETNEVFDNAMEAAADTFAALAPPDLSTLDAANALKLEQLALAGERSSYMTYQVKARAGAVVLRSVSAAEASFQVPAALGFTSAGGLRYFTRGVGTEHIIQVQEEPEERSEAFWGLLASFLAPLLPLWLAATYLASRLALEVGRPIVAIENEVSLRGHQSLDPIDAGPMPTELKPMVANINAMLDRLKRALAAERAFSANCAHELRNPIAVARANADLIAHKLTGTPEEDNARLQSEALARLGNLIERLLQLGRAEAGISQSNATSDLVKICDVLMDEYAHKRQSANRIDLDTCGLKSLVVQVDQDAAAIALRNLIDNAVAYSRPATEIAIKLSPEGAVSVTNSGSVVPSERLSHLVNRFERNGRVDVDGCGLGLAIVHQIASQSGGRLELSSPPPGAVDGFEAVLKLPLSRELEAPAYDERLCSSKGASDGSPCRNSE